MDLQYNPLLRDNLQYSGGGETPAPTYDDALSDTSENAVQNRIITEEITKITDTQKTKVTKFFESIEELEDGEIGEYQGESNEIFTNGYFYKRGTGTAAIKQKLVGDMSFMYAITSGFLPNGSALLQPNLNAVTTAVFHSGSSNQKAVFVGRISGSSAIFYVVMLPFDMPSIGGYAVEQDMNLFSYYDNGYKYQRGVIPPFAYTYASRAESPYYPIKIDNGGVYILYDGVWAELLASSSFNAFPGWDVYHVYCNYGSIFDACLLRVEYGYDVIFPYGDVLDMSALRVYPYAKYIPSVSSWAPVEVHEDVFAYSRVLDPAMQRINTQPPYKSQSLTLTTDLAGNVDTGLTLADIVPLCAYDSNNDVRLMLSVNNAQHIIITPASYSDATTRYPDTSFNCVLFYIEVPTT